MNLTCCIIDDEPHAIRAIEHCIRQTEGLELLFSESDPVMGLKKLGKMKIWPDIIFCDIDMPDYNGMDLGDLIREKSHLVYITAHARYAVEAFEKEAVDYLLKPIAPERFQACVEKCRKRNTGQPEAPKKERIPNSIFIHVSNIKGNYAKILLADLVFVRSRGNNLYFHRCNGEEIEAYMTFRDLEKMLDPESFKRANRSYIVNIDFVEGIYFGKVHLSVGVQIDLTSGYRKGFLDSMGNRVIRHPR